MKRNFRVLLVLIILLVLNTSFAEEDSAKSRKNYVDDEILVFNGTEYRVMVTRTPSFALEKNGNLTMMHIDECIESYYEKYCFESKDNKSVKIAYYELEPKVLFSQYLNKDNMWVGEERDINATIINEGTQDARYVNFVQYIPKEFEIIKAKKCNIHKQQIQWKGTVEKDDEHVCEYTIKPIEEGEFTIKANLTYMDSKDEDVRLEIKDYDIDVIEPFNYSIKILNSSISLGESFVIEFMFYNNHTKKEKRERNLSLTRLGILKDERIKPLWEVKTLSEEYQIIFGSKRLKINETLEFNLSFLPIEEFNDEIIINVNYKIEDKEYIDKNEEHSMKIPLILNVSSKNLVFNIEYPKKGIPPESNQTIYINYETKNTFTKFTQPLINISGIEYLEGREFRINKSKEIAFITPGINETRYFPITFTIIYFDEFNNRYEEKIYGDILVEQYKAPTISKKITYKEDNGTKRAFLNIEIINNADVNLSGVFYENNSFKVIDENIEIEGNEKKEYELEITEIKNLEDIILSNSTIIYSFGLNSMNLNKPMMIDKSQIINELTPPIKENNTMNETNIIEEESGKSFLPIIGIFAALIITNIAAFIVFKKFKSGIADFITGTIVKIKSLFSKKQEMIVEKIRNKRSKKTFSFAQDEYHKLIDQKQRVEEKLSEIFSRIEEQPEIIEKAHAIEQEYQEINKKIKEMENSPKEINQKV